MDFTGEVVLVVDCLDGLLVERVAAFLGVAVGIVVVGIIVVGIIVAKFGLAIVLTIIAFISLCINLPTTIVHNPRHLP